MSQPSRVSRLSTSRKSGGPVLEREFVVNSALRSRPYRDGSPTRLVTASTFGTVIRERLYDLGAIDERRASWKEVGGGWVVKLAFSAEQIDRDARWRFDSQKAALPPQQRSHCTLPRKCTKNAVLLLMINAKNG
jgi:hypothetical protein